jgi:hypothetical protein
LIPGLLYVDHLRERGAALFRAARERDLEGVVAKWRRDCYETDGVCDGLAENQESELFADGRMAGRVRDAPRSTSGRSA